MKVRTARLHHLHAGSDIGQAMLECASGADALKNTETAASVSSYTYTRLSAFKVGRAPARAVQGG